MTNEFELRHPVSDELAAAMTQPVSLFDYRAVGLATFFGSPLAGATLMAVNYRRLAKPAAAVTILGLGIALEIWQFVLGFERYSAALIANSLSLMIMRYGAKVCQGDQVARHVEAGGKLSSLWTAFGIAILTTICLIALFLLISVTQEGA